MKREDGQPTICSVLRGIKNKASAHIADRGVGIKDKMLSEIELAISMAKKMNSKLEYYKQKESKE